MKKQIRNLLSKAFLSSRKTLPLEGLSVRIWVLLITCTAYSQQEPQYTQYMYNMIAVNPAYAGSRDVTGIFGMYRKQWIGMNGAPDTGVFSIDTPIGNYVGLGLTFIKDQISIVDESSISSDFSYGFPISDNYKLAFGIKGSARLSNLYYSKLNPEEGNDAILNQADIENQFSPNVGAGTYLYSNKFYLGFSVPNILKKQEYKDVSELVADQKMHGYLITGYVFDLSHNLKFMPTALAKIIKDSPVEADLTGSFMFNEKLVLGGSWKTTGSYSGLVGFQVNPHWFIGYAYDGDTSKLSKFHSGSHEIFLRYEFLDNKVIESPRFF